MVDAAPEANPEFDPLLPDQSAAEKGAWKPTAEQLVSPPPHLRGEELAAWFLADLENAIGKEWCGSGLEDQPYVKRPRKSAPVAEPAPLVNGGVVEVPPGTAAQGELF